MGFFERQFQNDQVQGKSRGQQTVKTREPGLLMSNYYQLLITNFGFILFFLPAIACAYLYLSLGSVALLLAALGLLIPAGPACVSMYNLGYELARGEHNRKGFWRCCRENIGSGCGIMAVTSFLLLPMLACMTVINRAEQVPMWLVVCLVLEGYIISGFSILAFSQAALVALPIKDVVKNSFLLLVGLGWPIVLTALVQMAFVAALYQWIHITFLAFIFLGPACLVTWTAGKLWPKLSSVLIRE